jgi:hypothetical protein
MGIAPPAVIPTEPAAIASPATELMPLTQWFVIYAPVKPTLTDQLHVITAAQDVPVALIQMAHATAVVQGMVSTASAAIYASLEIILPVDLPHVLLVMEIVPLAVILLEHAVSASPATELMPLTQLFAINALVETTLVVLPPVSLAIPNASPAVIPTEPAANASPAMELILITQLHVSNVPVKPTLLEILLVLIAAQDVPIALIQMAHATAVVQGMVSMVSAAIYVRLEIILPVDLILVQCVVLVALTAATQSLVIATAKLDSSQMEPTALPAPTTLTQQMELHALTAQGVQHVTVPMEAV